MKIDVGGVTFDLVATDAIPADRVMLVAPPSRFEEQLMRGMTAREQAEFLALCGRVTVARNLSRP